ncbi:bifunctional NAD(P)H-hydrate repair enzyme [Chitiniphilus shinanonensis]|uniref:Bifunctional NAD(P)H-hydrate repair enzyme n=1 Tax=Chitiniphilus shinanonensis TaxID=553088 RepID=A0ABQ6BRU2_9NEIS|nr:bifunctional ADP-dependent NAD(P)H-hydrate dehydratase/NAD(P)H-hydrate epimerase [Chitiniphilus shinanonensis]GLS03935.1 bifunctional NAD(P)H-hydrate repair enzyme [Chitiniphilus shinanonensis]
MTPLYFSSTLRRIEQENSGAIPSLMQRAGHAAAQWIQSNFERQPIAVVVGPGNNGGDALVCARYLIDAGWQVCVHAFPSRRLSEENRVARQAILDTDGTLLEHPPTTVDGLIVDGLFGIGQPSVGSTEASDWITAINRHQGPIIALDLPSGLNGDSGVANAAAVHATHTLSFLGDKPGLHTAQGLDHAGSVSTFDLGLPLIEVYSADAWLIDELPDSLQSRPHDSHKGTYGSVGVLGGAQGMTGAALLAGRAALYSGAGKVYVGLLDPTLSVDPMQPELMLHSPDRFPALSLDVLAIGPGLGTSEQGSNALAWALELEIPLVIDADGLNLIAADTALKQALAARQMPTVLTPHPAEAARLLGITTSDVQSDRLGTAMQLANQFQCAVLLKGAGTICAAPGSVPSLNGSGNGALASGGQGDVLTGVIAALVAQGTPELVAAQLAAYAHGAAADAWRRQHIQGSGLTASETIPLLREQLNRISRRK